MTERSTLAEIVNLAPSSARVLERYDLDYCCHGQRPLSEACVEAGVDAAEVLGSLESIGEPQDEAPDWLSMDAGTLVDHIISTHHLYLHQEMPRIEGLAMKVAGVHGERHPELIEVRDTYRELQADLIPHLHKEEQVLFPMIREAAESHRRGTDQVAHLVSPEGPISVMLSEHDRAGELLERIRDLTSGYETPADGCASYKALYDGLAEIEADTHLHVHKENNVLFPMVARMEAAPT